jgi:hypothetical protein
VSKLIPTLLRIALASLHVTVGYAADALDAPKEAAAVSASDRVAVRATVPPPRTLDLRLPDLRWLQVQNMHQVVTSADFDEAEAVTIAATPLLPEETTPDTDPSLGGLASLYWAARHPTQAWRVFLPIRLDGDDAAADIRAPCADFAVAQSGRVACPGRGYWNRDRAAGRATSETLTERREMSANPSPTMIAPDTGSKRVRRTQSGEAT